MSSFYYHVIHVMKSMPPKGSKRKAATSTDLQLTSHLDPRELLIALHIEVRQLGHTAQGHAALRGPAPPSGMQTPS